MEYLHTIPAEYEEIRKNAKLLEKAYRNMKKVSAGSKGKRELQKILKRIKKLTNQCRRREAYQLVDMTMVPAEYIIRSEYFLENENTEENIKEIAREGILYTEILQECAELLKKIAEEKLLPIA